MVKSVYFKATNFKHPIVSELKPKEGELELVKVIQEVIDPVIDSITKDKELPIKIIIDNFNKSQEVKKFGLRIRIDEAEPSKKLLHLEIIVTGKQRESKCNILTANREAIIRELHAKERLAKRIMDFVGEISKDISEEVMEDIL